MTDEDIRLIINLDTRDILSVEQFPEEKDADDILYVRAHAYSDNGVDATNNEIDHALCVAVMAKQTWMDLLDRFFELKVGMVKCHSGDWCGNELVSATDVKDLGRDGVTLDDENGEEVSVRVYLVREVDIEMEHG